MAFLTGLGGDHAEAISHQLLSLTFLWTAVAAGIHTTNVREDRLAAQPLRRHSACSTPNANVLRHTEFSALPLLQGRVASQLSYAKHRQALKESHSRLKVVHLLSWWYTNSGNIFKSRHLGFGEIQELCVEL